MDTFSTPILFLIFNRPDATKLVFEEIRQQRPQYFYIAADGPREDKVGEQELCGLARKVVSQID